MTRVPILTIFVFVVFMILMPILLLNMLIAMMASTYDRIDKKSQKDWIYQWAKITIILEQTFTLEQLLKYQESYSVKIDNPAQIEKGNFSK